MRLENGLSLRALAQRLGYNAHSVVADIEKGRKIPSESLIRSYEECFALPAGSLLALRHKAVVERARRRAAEFASSAGEPEPPQPRPASAPVATPGPGPGGPEDIGPVGEESVGVVAARLVAALLTETRRVLDRWT